MMRVAVLGGGVTGLACAYYAQRAGLRPTILEATQGCGVLSQRFRVGDRELDCFHSPLSKHDLALRGLLAELGSLHRVVWREVETAVYRGGSVQLGEPGDFPPLSSLPRWDRLRAALASRVCRRWFQPEAELHQITGSEWLGRYYGTRIYERLWSPLLRARFGEDAEEISALAVSRFLRGLLGEEGDLRGYLLGGYAALCARLREALREGGSVLRLATPVRGVRLDGQGVVVTTDGGEEAFDAAISTLAMPDLAKIAAAQLLSQLPAPDLEQRGMLSVVALLRRPLALPYRVVDLDGSLGFEQVIAAGQLLPAAALGACAPVYLLRHCAVHGEEYRAGEVQLAEQARSALQRLHPGLAERDIEAIQVFRAPHVDPAWRVSLADRRPPIRVDRSRLYVCTAAQAHPRQAGSETSVVVAREAVRRVARDLRV
jgi:protoporphyrinogen oxidase